MIGVRNCHCITKYFELLVHLLTNIFYLFKYINKSILKTIKLIINYLMINLLK